MPIRDIKQLKIRDKKAIVEFASRALNILKTHLINIALFGSKVEGVDTPESDIDLLVLVDESSPSLKDAIMDLAFDVNLKHDVYISPRVISRDIFEHPVWKITPFIITLKTKSVKISL